ncbi:MAG TPA: glucuronate isomerase [Bacillota bacterium]|nr:glucuronate isomerase [Bacillota bacterium]
MKSFMDQDFLLQNETAVKFYHQYAEAMPIFDFHCHLSPKEIAENKKYRNITELWLGGDHYKWRAMRSNGVAERFITGDASDEEKFQRWAETMPYCIGNPLYHWTHLELRRYFGIEDLLSPKTAKDIWEKCNQLLKEDGFTAQGLITRSNVRVICTTDDPVDSLEYHQALANNKNFQVKVVPALRPDKGIHIERTDFLPWLTKLSETVHSGISNVDDIKDALRKRVEFFHQAGCRLSDHALDPVRYQEATDGEINFILKKALNHESLSQTEIEKYQTAILLFMAREYARLGWTMQLHMGIIRNNSRRTMNLLGPDTGFDSISDETYAKDLAKLLNALDETNELPKTILYCGNPRDNEVIGTMLGCFQGSEAAGKVQFGSGWWFNDQKDGMTRQMIALANLGLLSRFVGMVTDSRSFLSYTRHEYFRRILCNLLGEWVENGEVPNDLPLLGKMVQDISFNNAKEYFTGIIK